MKLDDFAYDLPPALIAKYPLEKRSASRLLCLRDGSVSHQSFVDLPSILLPGDLLVVNNSRVIPARMLGHKATGGKIELLIERVLDDKHILAHVRASKAPKPGMTLVFDHGVSFEVTGRKGDLFELRSLSERPVMEVIEAIGSIPIPPYFDREPEESDLERYQTVYAQHKGSVAAPTAGLHFDESLLKALRENGVELGYVTLHVGAGTFSPVRAQDITQHQMHAEYAQVSAELCQQIKKTKANGGRVIAVGTTAARSLETASLTGDIQPFSGETRIFIYPGFRFQCIDAMVTNFHLPCSTLLMMVAAFGGYANVMQAYQIAIAEQYRFYSYGDAMFVFKEKASQVPS